MSRCCHAAVVLPFFVFLFFLFSKVPLFSSAELCVAVFRPQFHEVQFVLLALAVEGSRTVGQALLE